MKLSIENTMDTCTNVPCSNDTNAKVSPNKLRRFMRRFSTHGKENMQNETGSPLRRSVGGRVRQASDESTSSQSPQSLDKRSSWSSTNNRSRSNDLPTFSALTIDDCSEKKTSATKQACSENNDQEPSSTSFSCESSASEVMKDDSVRPPRTSDDSECCMHVLLQKFTDITGQDDGW